jgi:hypothetical protein
MSSFLSTLVSRELGQAGHTVTPRLPSRYEPRRQKAATGMFEEISHSESFQENPDRNGSPPESRNPRQPFEESANSQLRQTAPVLPKWQQAREQAGTHAHQMPDSAPAEELVGDSVRSPALKESVSIRATREGDANEPASSIEGRGSETVHAARTLTGADNVNSSAQPAAQAAESREAGERSPHALFKPRPRLGAGELEAQQPAISVSSAVITSASGTPQVTPEEGKTPPGFTESGSTCALAGRENGRVADHEPLPPAQPDDRQPGTEAHIGRRARSDHDRKQKVDIQAAFSTALPVEEAGTPAMPEQKGGTAELRGSLIPAPLAASLRPASVIAPARSHSTAPLPSRREANTGPSDTIAREPTINVSIGRIEVRAIAQPSAPRHGKQAPKPMSLDEYLNKNSQRGRR